LKDILLIAYSMILGTPVSSLQAFGYTIALCGLLYYKIGVDQLKDGIEVGLRTWMKPFPGNSLIRMLGAVLAVLVILSFAILALAPNSVAKFGPNYDPTAYIAAAADKFGSGGV
jgi:hypothetical protein